MSKNSQFELENSFKCLNVYFRTIQQALSRLKIILNYILLETVLLMRFDLQLRLVFRASFYVFYCTKNCKKLSRYNLKNTKIQRNLIVIHNSWNPFFISEILFQKFFTSESIWRRTNHKHKQKQISEVYKNLSEIKRLFSEREFPKGVHVKFQKPLKISKCFLKVNEILANSLVM